MGENTRNESVSVGTSGVEISKPKKRLVLYLTNTGTTTITVCMSEAEAATAGAGIVLTPGQFITDSISEGYIPYQGYISAIGDGAGGTLSVFERVLN